MLLPRFPRPRKRKKRRARPIAYDEESEIDQEFHLMHQLSAAIAGNGNVEHAKKQLESHLRATLEQMERLRRWTSCENLRRRLEELKDIHG